MSAWAAVLLLGGACWVFRVLFIVLVPAHRLPSVVRRALGHLAPSVLAALVAVETASTAGAGSSSAGVSVVAAVVVIGLVAWRTGSLLGTIAIGAALAVTIDLVL
jgi:branched-subunit amino acid transport protein